MIFKKILLAFLYLPVIIFAQETNYPEDVKRVISNLEEKMEDVSNPIIATYLGSEFGDYFYFLFKDIDEKIYDFAYGDNDLGDIPFGDNDALTNSDLVGKKFIIYWEWKPSSFHCCEGRMNLYKANFPSILKIKYANK